MDLTKTLRVMKLTVLLLTVGIVHVSAKGTSQTVSFSGKGVPLATVFQQVEEQTGYVFFYLEKDLASANPVTLKANRQPLLEFLAQVFAHQPLQYSIQGKAIYVSVPAEPNKAPHVSLTAPPIDVHGTIKDENGNPLEGISVKIKGTNRGTTTNAYGEFMLTGANGDEVLIFTGTNIETFEKKLSGEKELMLSAKLSVHDLEEVVVNKGYYSVKQRENTGTVSVVKGEIIQKQPISDPIVALEGLVPGLSVVDGGGIPGSLPTVRLRGQNSIANGNNPLYLVDGVPFSSTSLTSDYFGGGATTISPFNSINTADIESIEVLKDADATAIYGSRGANGVILITTKKGKQGKTKVDFNIYSGQGEITKKADLLNTVQYLEMRHEALKNDGITAIPSTAYDINGTWDSTRYTDWQKVMIGKMAKLTNIQTSISGGNSSTQFRLGAGYINQTTVFPGNFSDRKGSVNLNVSHVSNDNKLRLLISTSFVRNNSNLPTTDYTQFIRLAPDAPALFNDDGTLNWENDTWENPFGNLSQTATAITNNLIASANLSYRILPGLYLKSNLGFNDIRMDQTMIFPLSSYSPSNSSFTFLRRNQTASNNIRSWIAEPQLSYERELWKGTFESMLSASFQENLQNSLSQYATDFQSDALIKNLLAATNHTIGSATSTQYKYTAIFGRIAYNFEGKYIINLTARRDGSSRFASRHQFGNFGAVGIAWIFSKEKWIQQSLPFLSFGKIRGSYGISGNDQSADYLYLSTYSSYPYSYQNLNGLYPTQIANPDFGWEAVKKLESSLDLAFFKDRLSIGINYYRNRTQNQLVGYPLPATSGFSTIPGFNLPAVIQNTGFEFVVSSINIKGKSLSWETSINMSLPRNKLISYPGLETSSYANSYEIGRSLFIKKLYEFNGVNPQTGLYTFNTKNSNGIPTNPADIVANKEITQKLYGGISNTVTYKGLQLYLLLQYVNQTGYNWSSYFSRPGLFGGTNGNQPTVVLDRWQVPGDISTIQRFSSSNSASSSAFSRLRFSDYTISDRSFARIKNLSLSYELPRVIKDKVNIVGCKIYVQCQNLLTISNYIGLDPETGSNSLPPLKMITLGIQVIL